VTRTVVVGGGITGLAAAHALRRDRPDHEVVLLEADARLGGKIRTSSFAGREVDAAADAFLARVPEAVDLCRQLGLSDDLVTPASRTAYVFTRRRLHQFPAGLVLGVPTDLDALASSGVVSAAAVERAAHDLESDEPPWAGDESVGALVRRRVGDEVYETLVAPLLSGVYAGDADSLSVETVAPQFVRAVQEHGSLIRGLRAQSAAASPDAPVFAGLRHGTQSLVDALERTITQTGVQVRRSTRVERVERGANGLEVRTAHGDVISASAVVITTPDPVTARLLASAAPDVARDLAQVVYASVVLVNLAFPPSSFRSVIDGTGFLVPATEPLLLTACSWASNKWHHLAGDPVILRASAGRARDPRAFELDDAALVEQLVADLHTTMPLTGAPLDVQVNRWPDALPQFTPGHGRRVAAWRERLADSLPGVVLAGAGIEGLGIPACIRQAEAATRAVLARASA
jgi:oxygen-dependent protoporphyrinogen oxidase